MLPRCLLSISLLLTFVLPGFADKTSDAAVRDRYLESALKHPRRGTAVERLYQLALQTEGVDALIDKLEKQATREGRAECWAVVGLLQEMRGRDTDAIDALEKAVQVDGSLGYPRLCLGQIHLARSEYDQGIKVLKAALECDLSPEDNLEIRKALGRCYLRSRQFDKAKEVWSELVKLAPEDAVTLKELTALLVEEEQWDEALTYYERLRELQQDRPYQAVLCTMAMGQVEARRGQFNAALARYEEALGQVKPDSWLATDIRSRVQELFRKRNDLSGLLEYYQKRLAGPDVRNVQTMVLEARLLLELDRAKEARPWYEKALELSPKDKEVRLAYIRLLELQKDYPAAIKQYEELLREQPDQPMWLEAVGDLHLQAGQDEAAKAKARECWEKIAATNPKDPATMVQVAEIFRSHDLSAEAGEYFRKAIELAPEVGQYREYYGEFLIKGDQRGKALEVFNQIAEGSRRSLETLTRLADVLSYFQYPAEAVAAAREAVDLKPDHFEARMQLAKLLGRQEKFDAALKELEEAAKLTPNAFFAGSVVDERIEMLQRAKRLEEAFNQEAEALAAKPADSAAPYLQCAKMAMALSRIDRADEFVDLALTQAKDSLPALELAAKVYARGSDSPKLVQTLRRLIELAPQNRKEYLRQLALHYAQLGDREEALKAAEQVIAAGPDDPESHGLLANLCERFGMADRSLDSLKEALKVDPKNVDLRLQYASQIERSGDYDAAIEQLWIVFETGESADDRLSTIRLLAESCYRADRFQQLIDRLERMRRLTRDEWLPTMCLAEAYRQIEDLSKARELLNALLAERPDDANLLTQVVRLASMEGADSEAVRHLTRLVQLEPSRKNFSQLAELQYELGRKDEALAAWRRIVEQADDRTEAASEVVRDLLIRDESESALELLTEASQQNPEDLELGFLNACALLKAERKDEAAREFLRVADLPDPPAKSDKNKDKDKDKSKSAQNRLSAAYLQNFPPELLRIQKISSVRYMINNQMSYAASSSGRRSPTGILQVQGDPDMMRAAAWCQYCSIAREKGAFDKLIESLRQEGSIRSLWKLVDTYLMQDQRPKELVDVLDALAAKAPNDMGVRMVRLSLLLDGRSAKEISERFDSIKAELDEFVKLRPDLEPFIASAYVYFLHRTDHKEELKEYAQRLASREITQPFFAEMALSVLVQAEELDAALQLLERIKNQASAAGSSVLQYRQYALSQLAALAIKKNRPEDAAQLTLEYLRQTRPKSARVMNTSPYSYARQTSFDFPSANAYYDQGRLRVLQQFYSTATGKNQGPYGFASGARAPRRLPGVSSKAVSSSQPAEEKKEPPSAALVALRRALEQEAKSLDEEDQIYAHLALAYFDWWDDHKADAAKHLTAVADLRPHDLSLKMSLAYLKYNVEDKEGALSVLESIPGRYHPAYQPAQQLTLRIAKDLGHTEKAKAAALRLFNLKLTSKDQLELAADLRELGLVRKAEQLEKRITSLSSGDLSQLVQLMRQRGEKGDKKEAANLAKQVLAHLGKAGPNVEYYRDSALRALKESGDLKEMIAAAEKQLAENPNALRVLMDLWNYYSAADDHEKAAAVAAKAVELRPDDLQFRSQLAKALLNRRQGDAAMVHYRYILGKDPSFLLQGNMWETVRAFRDAGKLTDLLAALTAMDFSKLSSRSGSYGPPAYQLVEILNSGFNDEILALPQALPFLNKLNDYVVGDQQMSYQIREVAEYRCRALLAEPKEYIRNWHVIGPFENKDDAGWDAQYPPETETFEPSRKYAGKDGEVQWVASAMGENLFNGKRDAKQVKSHEDIVVYAHTTIEAADAAAVKAFVGSDDAVKVWVNGKLVHENNTKRALRADSDKFDIVLNKGKNDVLLKIVQWQGEWGFCLRTEGADADRVARRLARKWEAFRYLLGFSAEFEDFKPVPPKELPAEAVGRPLGVKTSPIDLLNTISSWRGDTGDPMGLVDDLLKIAGELNQFEPMREHLAKAAGEELSSRIWTAMIDLRLKRIDKAKGEVAEIFKTAKDKQNVYQQLMWLDSELATKELWPESCTCCELILQQYAQSRSSGLESLLYRRWSDRLVKTDQKQRARDLLLGLAEYTPQDSYNPGYAEYLKQRNMLAAAQSLNEAGFYSDAHRVATRLSRMPGSANYGRYAIDEGARLAERILKAHPDLEARISLATFPLSENSVRIVWTPNLGNAHCQARGNTYVTPVIEHSTMFAKYEAEVLVSVDWKGPYHKLATLSADSQGFVHENAPTGKLLWYKVVFRNSDGQVAAVSEHVAGVAGPNLCGDGSMEETATGPVPSTRPAGESAGWVLTDPAGKPREGFTIAEGNRPISPGSRQLVGESKEEARGFARNVGINRSKEYIFGGYVLCERGDARLSRLALDEKQQPIRVFVAARMNTSPVWVFCLQRLAKNDELKYEGGSLERVEDKTADRLPAGQEFCRVGLEVRGRSLFDDVFLVEYTLAEDDLLDSLPQVKPAETDPVAAERLARQVVAAVPVPAKLVNGGFNQFTPDEPNLLHGWNSFGNTDGVTASKKMIFEVPSYEGEGVYFAQASSRRKTGGAWQTVQAQAGTEYRLTGRVYTRTEGDGARSLDNTARIGIDPSGGSDPDGPDVIWSDATESDAKWTTLAVNATARGSRISVFLRHEMRRSNLWNLVLFDDFRLDRKGAGISLATFPISKNAIQVVWTPDLGDTHCERRGNTYAVPIIENGKFYEGYEADVLVAAQWKGPYHKLATVAAERQSFTHENAPVGKLLWYKVLLRDSTGKLAAVSEHVAGVAGPNLCRDGSMERTAMGPVPATKPAGEPAGLVLADPSGSPQGSFVIEPGNRPASTGTKQLAAESKEEARVFAPTVPIDASKEYIFGGHLFCESGHACLSRLALDERQEPIRDFAAARMNPSPGWVFCLQRLAKDDKLKYDEGSLERVEDKAADRIPASQRFCRIGFEVRGRSLFDDVFLVEYALADDELLKDLPAIKPAEINPQAAERLAKQVLAAAPKPPEEALMLAVVPLGDNAIQLIWSAPMDLSKLDARGPIRMQTVSRNGHLFEGYQAEISVAESREGPYRFVTEVPASPQTYVRKDIKPNALLWCRVVLRDDRNRVVAVSRPVPAVAGENLVANGSLEAPSATQPSNAAWTTVAAENSKTSGSVRFAGPPRPFGAGSSSLSGQASDGELALQSPPLAVDPTDHYLFGGWIRVAKGQSSLGRLAFDKQDRAILSSESLRIGGEPAEWVFVSQQLGRRGRMRMGTDGSLEIRKYGGNTDVLPMNQKTVRVTFSTTGSALLDDVFIIRYKKESWPEVRSLMAAPVPVINAQAAAEFERRCRQAIPRDGMADAKPAAGGS